MASAPCTLVPSNQWLGIYYADASPTVTLTFVNAALNQASLSNAIAGGATSWTVVDGAGTEVGSGTCLSTDTTITPVSSGSFVGGSAVKPGYYTVKTDAGGTNGVCVGNFVVCPGSSNLWKPASTPPTTKASFAAWMGSSLDRDYYGFSPANLQPPQGANSASVIATQRGEDEYFLSTQDSARPRKMWVATGPQTNQTTTVASGSNGTDVSTFTGTQSLDVASTSPGGTGIYPQSFPSGGGALLLTTSAGRAVVTYTGVTSTSFTNCTLVQGSGTLSTGATVRCIYPSPADFTSAATTLKTDGYTGCYWELPCNEPDIHGWSMSDIALVYDLVGAAVLAEDSTAKLIGWCSGGYFSGVPISDIGTFLADITEQCNGLTVHMEATNENLSNIVALRQYLGAAKSELATAGSPNLDLFLTETGINGGLYGVLQPRREARQRTVLRFVAESYGWAKENCYDFPVFDHHGSGLSSYLVDSDNGDAYGNLRAGAYALHVMAEALYSTSCSPTDKPTALDFGPAGSLGDSLFAGTHYAGTSNDVVILATNTIDSASVTLDASAAPTACWDGWGADRSWTTSGTHYTIPVDDLLTYVFFPTGTAVSVVDTDQAAVAFSTSVNLALDQVITNGAGTDVAGVVNDGSFAQNKSGITGVATPYTDSTVPSTLTLSPAQARAVVGYAVMTPGNPWQSAGWGILSCSLSVDGTSVDSYSCASASSEATPSASNLNSSDPCTRTSWWTGATARLIKLSSPSVATSSIELSLTGSYGGQPDSASSDNTTSSNLGVTPSAENDAQHGVITEFQVYQLGPPGSTGGGGPFIGTGS